MLDLHCPTLKMCLYVSRMMSMRTDTGGSSAQFSPSVQDSSAMQAYSLFSSCGVGSFQNESSVGGMQQCPPCTEVGNCSFQQIALSSYVCTKCNACSHRDYVDSWIMCDRRPQDAFNAECKSCKMQCAVGQFIDNTCSGLTETNTEVCANCTSCPYGHFYTNHSGLDVLGVYVEDLQVCNGVGLLDSDGDKSCTRCNT